LLEILLEKLLLSQQLNRADIYLGAYDEEIKQIGRRLGIQIYERTYESVQEPVALEVSTRYVWDLDSEYFITVNACNPLLRIATIDHALQTFQEKDIQSLLAVIPRQNFFFDKQSNIVNKPMGDPQYFKTMNTKMVEPLYESANSIYIWNAEYMKKNFMRWALSKDDPYLYTIPPAEAFDIDDPWQFHFAEMAYQNQMEQETKSA